MSQPQDDARHFRKIDVSAERVARVYAESLLASAGDEAEDLGDELNELVNVACKKDPQIYAFLASSTIATKTKTEFFEKFFRGKASDKLVDFLQVVNSHGRLELIHAITSGYTALLDEKKKRVPVVVKTAVPLDDSQRQALKKQLNEIFHVEPILHEEVDSELLGGILVRIGDWQFDGTVKARLNQLKNQLLERSSHEIQGRRDRFCTV